jgi:glycosyltransferase involved in cell wall biosynthesis
VISVLIVAEETERNTFIHNLSQALAENNCEVEIGIDKFWNSEKHFDIIHFHWPEHLSYKFRRKSLPPTPFRLNRIKQRIAHWKQKGSKLVLTQHNTQSHEYPVGFAAVYDHLNKTVDGLIHMGNYSLKEYKQSYPNAKSKQALIPHGWYDNIPNNISSTEARNKLNLDENSYVILAFGALRKKEEENFIISAFESLDVPNKVLLIPRGYYHNNILLFRLFDYLQLGFYKHWIKKKSKQLESKGILWDQRFIPIKDIQDYFNASDGVLIPRLEILNSGNVPMAFYFKKPVIGPNQGNVGSILEETNNFIFDVEDRNSLQNAFKQAQTANKLGIANYQFAKTNWNWSIIGQQHADFYTSLI